MIQIVIDDRGSIKAVQSILASMPLKVKQVVRRASVDALRAVKAEIPRAVSARYALTKSAVRSHMQVRQVSEDGGMRSGIIVSGRKIPSIDFDVQPKTPPPQQGVPVAKRTPIRITTIRGQTKIGKPNRFIAQMRSGHIGVFMKKTPKSLPIRESMSESIREMIRVKEIRKKIEDRASDVLTKSIQRNIKSVLEKP
jgi:hypothetical protein